MAKFPDTWEPMYRFRCPDCGFYAREDIAFCPHCYERRKAEAELLQPAVDLMREYLGERPIVWPVGAQIPIKR